MKHCNASWARVLATIAAAALLLRLGYVHDAVAQPAGSADPTERAISLTVAAGDTLDGMLAGQGLGAALRAEAALAIAAEFEPERLQPGNLLEIRWRDRSENILEKIALSVDNGIRIEVDFGDTALAQRIDPNVETVQQTAVVEIDATLVDSLEAAGVPLTFAVELPELLGDLLDLRGSLPGAPELSVIWLEDRQPDGKLVGEAQLRYARLQLEDRDLEIVMADAGPTWASIYESSTFVRNVPRPVVGARLSSVFGRRLHPIYGNVRMHTGVDYAAPRGTPIASTGPGSVSFVGAMGGYGKVVDIDHGEGLSTRYAHLSGFADGLSAGSQVTPGQIVGTVGATGTATGPNLHYETRIDGRPVDPLAAQPPGRPSGAEPSQAQRVALADLRAAIGKISDWRRDVVRNY